MCDFAKWVSGVKRDEARFAVSLHPFDHQSHYFKLGFHQIGTQNFCRHCNTELKLGKKKFEPDYISYSRQDGR